MRKYSHNLLQVCIALLLLTTLRFSYGASESVVLLPRTHIAIPEIKLNPDSVRWLEHRQKINMAIWGKSHPPLFMGYDQAVYEGIGADYANIVSKALNKTVVTHYFSSQQEAKEMLDKGEIDLLAFYVPSMTNAKNIRISAPYLLDHTVVMHNNRLNSNELLTLNNKKLGYIADEYAQELLTENYLTAKLMPYAYFGEATAALTYGAVDAFWLNASTARFMINQGMEANVKMALSQVAANSNISFAAHADNQPLIDAIDATLAALPLASRLRISNNWGLDASFVMKHNPLMLTRQELAWISKHSEVPVYLPQFMAPVSFRDDEGRGNGYVLSLLKQISERTGLQFRSAKTPASFTSSLFQGDMQQALIAAKIKNSQTRDDISHTRSFLITPWVLVVDRSGGETRSLSNLAGEKVTIARNSGLVNELKKRYPQIIFEQTANDTQAMLKVARKQAAAAISPQIAADFLINKQFHNRLAIANSVGLPPAHFSMAVSGNNPLLLSILNKAMVDLSPQALQRDLAPWHNYQAPAKVTVWDKYSRYLLKLAGVCVVVLLFFGMRNRYLRNVLAERTRYEQQLENQLRFTRTLIDDSPVALYVRDRQSRMLQCNNTYLQFLHTSLEAVEGKTLHESGIISHDGTQAFQELYSNTLQNQEPSFTRQQITTSQGEQLLVYHWTLPYRDHRGDVTGIIGGFIDITEREQLLSDLQQSKLVAEKANASKSIFLSQMSHEIRTPLNALIGLLELEHRQISPPDKRAANIAVAWQASQSLLSLVGNILDMAKIESGIHNIKKTPVSLVDSVRSLMTLFSHAAAEKKLELLASYELNEPNVLFDQTMFNQIVSNLLSNAIKFTTSGQVEVALYQGESSRANHNCYVLEVCDTGTGLTDYQQQAIFEPFVQIENVRQEVKGTGLGLSICRQLATRLGGQLTVESELGEGTTFIFSFLAEPYLAGEAATMHALLPAELVPKTVLVVDDHPPNRLLLCQQLESVGHHAVAVESGEQALIRWDMVDTPFDIVISDCNMPGMDGFTLIAKLREKELQSDLPARPMFGLTAMAEREVSERGKRAGMTACLFKPLSMDRLLAQIEHPTLEPDFIAQNSATSHQAHALEPLSIDTMPHLNARAREEMIKTLLESNAQDVKVLLQAIQLRDNTRVRSYAHRLLGSARVIRATYLGEICREIEEASDRNHWEMIQDLFRNCNEEVGRIADILRGVKI